MKWILVGGMIAEIEEEMLANDLMDVSFGSSLMLQIGNVDGKLRVLNAMNGYGDNCQKDFKDAEVKMLTESDSSSSLSGWIDVKDRLPDESGRYWCYVRDLNDLGISHYQWNCCYSKEENRWSDKLASINVTHWQPLPSPPPQL